MNECGCVLAKLWRHSLPILHSLSGVSPKCQGSLSSGRTITLISPSCTTPRIPVHTQPWGSRYGNPSSLSHSLTAQPCTSNSQGAHTQIFGNPSYTTSSSPVFCPEDSSHFSCPKFWARHSSATVLCLDSWSGNCSQAQSRDNQGAHFIISKITGVLPKAWKNCLITRFAMAGRLIQTSCSFIARSKHSSFHYISRLLLGHSSIWSYGAIQRALWWE